MAIETGLGDVEGAAHEPAIKGCLAVIEYLVPGLLPLQFLRLLDPECLRISGGFLVDPRSSICPTGQSLGWRE